MDNYEQLCQLEQIAMKVNQGFISENDYNFLREVGVSTLGVASTETYLGQNFSNESVLNTILKGGLIVIILAIISKILGGGGSSGGGGGGGGGIVAISKTVETAQKDLDTQAKVIQERVSQLESRTNARLEKTMQRMIEDVKINREIEEFDKKLEQLGEDRASIEEEAKLYAEQIKFIDSVFKYELKSTEGTKRKIAMAKALQKYGNTIKNLADGLEPNSSPGEGESNEQLVLRVIVKGEEVDRMHYLQKQRVRNISQTPIANDRKLADEYGKALDDYGDLVESLVRMAERLMKVPDNAWDGISNIIDKSTTAEEAADLIASYGESDHHVNFASSLESGSEQFANYLAMEVSLDSSKIDPRTGVIIEKMVARKTGESIVHKTIKEFSSYVEKWFNAKTSLNPSLAIQLLDVKNGPLSKRIDRHSDIGNSLERLERALKELSGKRSTEDGQKAIYVELTENVFQELKDKFPEEELTESIGRKVDAGIGAVAKIGVVCEMMMREILIGYGKFNFAETQRLSNYQRSMTGLVSNLETAEKSLDNLTTVFNRAASTESHHREIFGNLKWLVW